MPTDDPRILRIQQEAEFRESLFMRRTHYIDCPIFEGKRCACGKDEEG